MSVFAEFIGRNMVILIGDTIFFVSNLCI